MSQNVQQVVLLVQRVMAAFGHANSAQLKRRKGSTFVNKKGESIRKFYELGKTLGS